MAIASTHSISGPFVCLSSSLDVLLDPIGFIFAQITPGSSDTLADRAERTERIDEKDVAEEFVRDVWLLPSDPSGLRVDGKINIYFTFNIYSWYVQICGRER